MCDRSEGFPLTGLFHPWAQWDRGLDTLENSSRRVAAVVALGGTNLLPTYLPTTNLPTYLPTYMPKEWAYMPKERAYMPKEWA